MTLITVTIFLCLATALGLNTFWVAANATDNTVVDNSISIFKMPPDVVSSTKVNILYKLGSFDPEVKNNEDKYVSAGYQQVVADYSKGCIPITKELRNITTVEALTCNETSIGKLFDEDKDVLSEFGLVREDLLNTFQCPDVDNFHLNGSNVLNHIDNGVLQNFQLSIIPCDE